MTRDSRDSASMLAISSIYFLVSLALGAMWIAPELGAQPLRTTAREFLVAALAWPAILIFVTGLVLFTKSKPHDTSTAQ